MRTICLCLLLIVVSLGLISCGDRLESTGDSPSPQPLKSKLSEVAPPPVIRELAQTLESYQPQVSILSPKSNQLLQDTSVNVQLQVRDLPLFQNEALSIGPHLNLILDNEPSRPIYNVKDSFLLEDLSPGTHSIRVFASRPWDESFKNEGAYDQVTFHIFSKTEDNNPDLSQPLLTYNSPQGTYGAEPILLDFYLTNAPLHLVAQQKEDDQISDWRIRATINGQSFLLDSWQPVYLKGFNEGKNWVQLEFIDEAGNNIKNVFNNTVRVITYQPNGEDTLSKLVRGELSLAVARGLVDPNYQPPTPPLEEPPIVEPETPVVIEPETTQPVEPESPVVIEPEATQPIEPESPVVIEPETTQPIEPETEANALEAEITTNESDRLK
ncbi:MAG: hypothetical protein DSM107014_04075 [Gomphosphaeria aponina SAG 52.96 = DSM 107014]|uniref:FHA domain containing protein n=1 Tax=Gomphosphaeria aponina SAG 52.96 = DSM 107014 TaxID=1521640 RepID=A0A941GX19_9CHRO|nr:hypothetical protein [Gomphosphaeria aponina SAG 52.96 = DSM 107014]